MERTFFPDVALVATYDVVRPIAFPATHSKDKLFLATVDDTWTIVLFDIRQRRPKKALWKLANDQASMAAHLVVADRIIRRMRCLGLWSLGWERPMASRS